MKQFVKVYDNVIDPDICRRICERYDEHEQRKWTRIVRPVTVGHDETISNVLEGDGSSVSKDELRMGTNLNASICPINKIDPYFDRLITKAYSAIMDNAVEDYITNVSENILSKDIWFWKFKQVDLLKYPRGTGFYKEHIDTNHKDTLPRFLTVLTYLNDVEDGGETGFRWQDMKVQPKVGRTVVFPATWNFPHSSELVVSNDKYAMIMWGETIPTEKMENIVDR